MNKAEYQSYLHTRHWITIRKKVWEKYQACQLCGSKLHLQVHHLSYERLGYEKLADLRLVCEKCHKKCHFIWFVIKVPTIPEELLRRYNNLQRLT